MTENSQSAFKALADPTRRDIVKLLMGSDMTIVELTGHFDMTRAAGKKHLTVLSDGGAKRKQGQQECSSVALLLGHAE